MYNTPASNRLHIGIFGRRNSGKSSLINALTGQKIAIVSKIAGTTTDPVYKAMEILPIGPCVLIDTAGIDDEGALGNERIRKTYQVLRKTDIALLVVEPDGILSELEHSLIKIFNDKKQKFLIVRNKSDLHRDNVAMLKKLDCVSVSSLTKQGIDELKQKIINIAPPNWTPVPLVRDIISKKNTVVLVCPVDSAMPQGRLILPEVQVLREILDANSCALVTKETELKSLLHSLKVKPDLVITDSQVFELVKDIVPENIALTSFSIIFARHKGDINTYIEGVYAVEDLKDGDKILIAEACTHHIQPEDIGRVKIPAWLRNYTGKDLKFDITAGGEFPDDIARYKLIIACGGCMVKRNEIQFRIEEAKNKNIPITNYGIIIAYISGILNRVTAPLEKGVVKINKRLMEKISIKGGKHGRQDSHSR